MAAAERDPNKVIPLGPAVARARIYRENAIAVIYREIEIQNWAANHRQLGQRDPAFRAHCLDTAQRLQEAIDLVGAEWVAGQEIGTRHDPGRATA